MSERCAYCAAHTRTGPVCRGHRDLPALDLLASLYPRQDVPAKPPSHALYHALYLELLTEVAVA